jgi:uncharacterized FlaG/YvyC family protein
MKRVEGNKRLKNVALKMILPQTLYPEQFQSFTTTATNQILHKNQILHQTKYYNNRNKPNITSNQILHQNTKLNPDLELISQQFTNLDQWLNTNLNQWLNTNLNQLVSSIIENHRLRSEEPKSTQTPGYNYRTNTTRQQASNATNKQASKATNKQANRQQPTKYRNSYN